MSPHIIVLYDLATQNESQIVCELLGKCLHHLSLLYDRISIYFSMINVQMCDQNKYFPVKKSTYLIITSRLHHVCAHLTKKYKNHLIKYITSSRLYTLDNLESTQMPLLNIDNEEDRHILIQDLHKHILNYSNPPFQNVVNKIISCFQVQKQNPTGFNDISLDGEEGKENLIPINFCENIVY